MEKVCVCVRREGGKIDRGKEREKERKREKEN